MNNHVCMAKEGVDFRSYGFRYDSSKKEYSYWINTRRITITNKLILKFNSVSVDVLMKFAELVKDGVVYFIEKQNVKTRLVALSKKEYEMIMATRKENKE